MLRHPDLVTVGVPIGAHLLRRLDAVTSDLGLDRPDALHAALLCWLEQEERKNRYPRPHAHDTCVDEDRRAHRVRTPTDICLQFGPPIGQSAERPPQGQVGRSQGTRPDREGYLLLPQQPPCMGRPLPYPYK